MNIAWFSGGITSAVASYYALEEDKTTQVYFIETGSHHSDTQRFIKDCSEWYKTPINILQSRYTDHFHVVQAHRFINSPQGAKCTQLLKTRVRQKLEYYNTPKVYYWGFEYSKKEIGRAKRLQERYPDFIHKFPLIERELTKPNCLSLIKQVKIEIPEMYKLGYQNNNCIGCVKGGMGYWNKIRKDFPEVFNRMSLLERDIGRSCIKGVFLDELEVGRGRLDEILPECDGLCSLIELEEIENSEEM